MSRPKVKIDYFPHVTQTGKTIAILQARWGNDGYAFWFKLLELLGDTREFYYDCNGAPEWEYLLSRAAVTEAVALDILAKLAEIRAIDPGLWEHKVVWSDNFIHNLSPLFERRKAGVPAKPVWDGQLTVPAGQLPATGDKEKQSKEKESKGEESKEKENRKPEPEPVCLSGRRPLVRQRADTVYLTDGEVDALVAEHGLAGAQRIISLLDAYKTNRPDKCAFYRDDYKMIGSWVASCYRQEMERTARGRPRGTYSQSFAMRKLSTMAEAAMAEEAAADEPV